MHILVLCLDSMGKHIKKMRPIPLPMAATRVTVPEMTSRDVPKRNVIIQHKRHQVTFSEFIDCPLLHRNGILCTSSNFPLRPNDNFRNLFNFPETLHEERT